MAALLMAVALAATSPPVQTPAPPAPSRLSAPAAERLPPGAFKCQDGGALVAQFENRGAVLVAVVDAGDGPHALPLRPWDGGEPQITWSDGKRTLTWSPGVQLMWMDGSAHRMCGGAHKHEGH